MEDKLIVTGYIPIPGHPRSAKEYGELGAEMFSKVEGRTVFPFYEQVEHTWLSKLVKNAPYPVTHSAGDNPEKNSLAYHCVQHQKFGWLVKAAYLQPQVKTFVWMDYGIGHVPGVTPDVVNEFMANVSPGDFAIPGCWEEGHVVNDFFPSWRFCGGLMVVPRNQLHRLYKGVKYTIAQHIQKTRNVWWEVNTLAAAEPNLPPIRWYKADHDKTMFTNYKLGAPQEVPHVHTATKEAAEAGA